MMESICLIDQKIEDFKYMEVYHYIIYLFRL